MVAAVVVMAVEDITIMMRDIVMRVAVMDMGEDRLGGGSKPVM